MSRRHAFVLGAVVVAGVVASLLFRSHGGRKEPPPADAPAQLAPSAAASPSAAPPAIAAALVAEPSAPPRDRPDAGVPSPHARAIHDALVGATAEGGRLYADIARAGRPIPPEARALVEMKRAGASAADLRAYVQTSFPPDASVRATALKWLRLHTPDPPLAADAAGQARSRISRTTPTP